MRKKSSPQIKNRQDQRGAAALEFALLFTIFFGVFYAIVSYTFVLLIVQGLSQAASEGARESARLDPLSYTTTELYTTALTPLIRTRVTSAISWLPQKAQDKIKANGGITVTPGTTGAITVKVSYQGYKTDPIIPILDLPIIGPVPSVPDNLIGQNTFRPN